MTPQGGSRAAEEDEERAAVAGRGSGGVDGGRDVRLPRRREMKAAAQIEPGWKAEMRRMQITPSCNIDEESGGKGRNVGEGFKNSLLLQVICLAGT